MRPGTGRDSVKGEFKKCLANRSEGQPESYLRRPMMESGEKLHKV